MVIRYHPQFKKSYKNLSPQIKLKAEVKEKIFRQNPFHPSLDTHKLHGKLKNQWSFSIDREFRILFEFNKSDVILLDVGDHEIYR